MNTITRKLRSGKGASITFALLLFLVCAVLCSVIITAASAAAGRISNMAEADQRYYSVTSACELLKDLISDKTVTIVEATPEGDDTTKYIKEGVSGSEAIANYSTDLSYEEVDSTYEPESLVSDIACRYFGIISGDDLDIELSGPVEGVDPPKVEVKKMDKGEMILEVSTTTKGNTHPFVMEMIFKADEADNTSTKETDHNGENSTININARSVTWTLESMRIN